MLNKKYNKLFLITFFLACIFPFSILAKNVFYLRIDDSLKTPQLFKLLTNNNYQNVIYLIDSTDFQVGYNIYRSDINISEPWVKIGHTHSNGDGFFIDSLSNEFNSLFSYAITACDDCGNESQLSLPLKKLTLEGSLSEESFIKLTWEKPSKGIVTKIYRGTSPEMLRLIDVIKDTTSYIDVPEQLGTYYYQIENVLDHISLRSATIKNMQNYSNLVSIYVNSLPTALDSNKILSFYSSGTGAITISFPNFNYEKCSYRIIDYLGNTLQNGFINSSIFRIPFESKKQGLYFIVIVKGEKTYTQRIICY